ncbi:MAG: hypothetical protein JJE21_10990 [Spirochaetaceae bacterium]|nr:hypothetical protein [Spirochaetaceae bacterium]
MGIESILYSSDSFYFYPTIAIYGPGTKTFGALLDNINNLDVDESTIISIPCGLYLIDYHFGPYEGIQDHLEKLRNDRSDLRFSGITYNFNILDQFNSSNPEKYLTRLELQLNQ